MKHKYKCNRCGAMALLDLAEKDPKVAKAHKRCAGECKGTLVALRRKR